jgi:hypothetical protein
MTATTRTCIRRWSETRWSLMGPAPSRAWSRRRRRGTTGRSADAVVHQCPQLSHQIRPDYQSRVVALSLQRPEDLFSGPALPGAGEFKGSFKGGDVRGRHRAFLQQCPEAPTSTLMHEALFPESR